MVKMNADELNTKNKLSMFAADIMDTPANRAMYLPAGITQNFSLTRTSNPRLEVWKGNLYEGTGIVPTLFPLVS